jgi:hypothetical protein
LKGNCLTLLIEYRKNRNLKAVALARFRAGATAPIFVPYGILPFTLTLVLGCGILKPLYWTHPLHRVELMLSSEGCCPVEGEGEAEAADRATALGRQVAASPSNVGHMVNNSSIQKWQRLQQKQLENQFIRQVCDGCRCSPFEAQAVLQTVYTVFSPFFDNATSLKPGQIQIPVTAVESHPSQSLAEAPCVLVTLTLCDDGEDLLVRECSGVIGLRLHRLQRICREALQQGGLLTVEDLANRLLNCGERTICRDIKTLKKQGISLPLRSTVKDMGRTLSHRCDIVRHWLSGKEYSQIARDSFHSVPSVQNYVSKFKRVATLTLEGFDIHTIAFLVRISSSLVLQYQELFQSSDIVPHRKDELSNMPKKTTSLSL